MGQNDDHIGQEDEDPSRTLDAVKPLYELGSRIGGYKLLSVLGEGGFGTVYLAEQEHPIKRLVALKVIKPGMDTKQVIARFETERQALAMLDHPHIARVFDAGATEAGRPYFAMEYVKGIPITEYCDKYKLGTQERLRLFIPLCQAIQHAHHKGIIHRDIKPSNAMVMLHDEKPIPKVIDFGVAKALNQRLTEKTVVTEKGEFIGTPEYMSPEQAELTGLDVDTRTDIYSLGVLLYELLTGCTPFDPEDLRSKGYARMQRIICEQDPVKPSTKLTTLGGKLEDIAKHHSATADQLRKSVRGDLDWIVMKAMEKDRTRRYETANNLAQDLERHLNNEPVMARPPSKLYRFQKLVRRNKGVFTAIGAVAVVLVLGVIVSTWQAVRAAHAEREQSRLREDAVAAQEVAVAAQEKEAAQRRKAEAEAYASDMSLAQQALAANDLGRAKRLLEGHRPAPGEVDLRGWEWRYLWQECRSDTLGEFCRYPRSAYSVAYSPDGRVLAVAGLAQDFIVEIWDVPGCKRIATLQPSGGTRVAFSPRGDLLATIAGYQIRLWRTGTTNLVGQLNFRDSVRVLKFSPDGRRLAGLSHPGEVTVWEVDPWTVVRQIRGVRVGSLVGVLDFSPDGKALVIGDADHHLQVVDLASGNTNFDIAEAHPEAITAVAWSPNGSVIASGSGFIGGPIRLWDAASGKPLDKLEGHTEYISQLIFSTDGLRLYSASGDQTIRIWDVGQRRCLATLRGSSHELYGLALSPDGTTLASACKDGVVAFWSAVPRPEEEMPRLIELGQFVWTGFSSAAFTPDSRVVAAPRAGTVSLFDLATSKEIERLPALGTDGVSMVAYSPDGTLLVSGSRRGKIRVWSCAERRLLRELDGHKESIFLLCFRADGTRLLSIDVGGKVIWWDALTWQAGATFVVEPSGGAAVSPDGHLLAIGAAGALRWLNAETGELLHTTTGGHSWPVYKVAFSGDGSQVASVSAYGTVELWDPSSFQLIDAFKGHMTGAHAVAFSPDGRWLATGGGTSRDAVKLWDLATHRELMTLSGQSSLFSFVSFSPDGRWLAACSRDGGRLHLWRAPSWAEIAAAEKRPQSRFGADSSALIQDWPRDESDARTLWLMVQGYQRAPERMAEAEQLRRRLIEVLQEAVASRDANSIQGVERLADVYLSYGRYDDAEQLYLRARDQQLAKSGAKAKSFLDLTEELVRFYLDVLNRYDKAEPLCLELLKTRREVLGADNPRTIRTRVLLARIYERQKRYQEAERIYLDILNIQPSEDARESRPEVYESVLWPWTFAPLSYFLDEASLVLRLLEYQNAGIAKDKLWPICAHYLLARLYATCPMAELHNVTGAIEHGTTACELSGWAEPICLDALAAAYAEAGRFDLAVQRQKEAIERLSGNKAWMRTVFVNHLTMYEHGVAKSPKGLVARWEFEQSKDGMVADTSGNNLHGRLVGDAQVYADPERGNVLRLDGEGDWVDCGADARFDVSDEITISAWIKVGKFDKEWQAIVTKGDSTWRLLRNRTTDALVFACSGVDTPEMSYYGTLYGRENVNDGQWHHVAGVYDGRRLSLYIDGGLDTFTPALAFTRINTSTDHVLIGGNAGTQPPREWNGLIDDLRIYSYALPPEDIKALHEAKEPAQNKGSTR